MVRYKHTYIRVDDETWKMAKVRAMMLELPMTLYLARLLKADLDKAKEVESELEVRRRHSLR